MCCGPLPERLPSVIVDTEKVLREADGSVKLVVARPHTGWNGVRPWVRLDKRTVRAGEEPDEHKRECFDCRARITSKELAPIHSVKCGTLQNACSTRP